MAASLVRQGVRPAEGLAKLAAQGAVEVRVVSASLAVPVFSCSAADLAGRLTGPLMGSRKPFLPLCFAISAAAHPSGLPQK